MDEKERAKEEKKNGGGVGVHTSNIKPRHRDIWRSAAAEEFRRQCLDPIPHRRYGIGIDVIEPRVRRVAALGRGARGAGVELARLGQGRSGRVG